MARKLVFCILMACLLLTMVGSAQEYLVGTCPPLRGYILHQVVVGSRVFCDYGLKKPAPCNRVAIPNHTLNEARPRVGGFTCEWQLNPPYGTPPHP